MNSLPFHSSSMRNACGRVFAALSSLGVGLLAPGCISAEVTVEDVQVTRHHLVFPGATSKLDWETIQSTAAELREEYDLPKTDETVALPSLGFSFSKLGTELPKGVSTRLRLKSISVRSHERTADLSFIRQALLTVTSGDTTEAAPQMILDYRANDREHVSPCTELQLPLADRGFEIDPVRLDSRFFELSIWAAVDDVPVDSWAIDLTLSLSGDVAIVES